MFGCDSGEYGYFESDLPKKVIRPDKKKNQGRFLDIQYIPLYDKNSKLVKLMFVIDDITELEQDLKKLQDTQSRFDILNDLLSFKEKGPLSIDLSNSINNAVNVLEEIIKYEVGSNKVQTLITEIKDFTIHLESNSLKNLPMISRLIN